MYKKIDLKEKIAGMPDAPGVYLMKDDSGKIIYIGKAKSLKKRLNNYFGRDLSTKTAALMSKASDIECRLCPTETVALLLEANLIHQCKPKYNVSLRDDKSFPFVKITHEDFPAVYITRKKENDAGRYLGPYTNAKLLKSALKIIRRYLPYRSCKNLPKKPCIYYRLGLSPAPCIGKIKKDEYAHSIENICLILQGKADSLIKKLTRQMQVKAAEKQFEEAAKIRDQIMALGALSGKENYAVNAGQLEELKDFLRLPRLPERIEAFDISNISGKEATASMVSFWKGQPDKNNYRRFRIKAVTAIDDYGMLAEAVQRRYLRLCKENLPFPDLILIDGGRSHLSVAKKELEKLGVRVPLMSIAKEKENIYTERSRGPLNLKKDAPALNLIRRVRDEAHRFAISYHHILRRKKIIGR